MRHLRLFDYSAQRLIWIAVFLESQELIFLRVILILPTLEPSNKLTLLTSSFDERALDSQVKSQECKHFLRANRTVDKALPRVSLLPAQLPPVPLPKCVRNISVNHNTHRDRAKAFHPSLLLPIQMPQLQTYRPQMQLFHNKLASTILNRLILPARTHPRVQSFHRLIREALVLLPNLANLVLF